MITFMDQETTENSTESAVAGPRSPEHRQELTSKSHLLRHRLNIFDAVVTLAIMYGTRHGPQKNTKIRSVHCSAECFVSTKIKNNIKDPGGIEIQDDEMIENGQEEDSTNDECDQDSRISFEIDTESTSSQEKESEDWIEYIKRSARELLRKC